MFTISEIRTVAKEASSYASNTDPGEIALELKGLSCLCSLAATSENSFDPTDILFFLSNTLHLFAARIEASDISREDLAQSYRVKVSRASQQKGAPA